MQMASYGTGRLIYRGGVKLMVIVFSATFNTISIISWRSDLLVEETRVSEENHRPAANHGHTLSHHHGLRQDEGYLTITCETMS